MQKTAQTRNIFNKIRDWTNISGKAAENFFNPQFKEVMETLREVDSNIRSIVAGKSVEGGEPGSDAVSLKDLLKSSKSNLNRKEYMTAVAELGRFHKKVFEVTQQVFKLNNVVDKVHHQFLFQDLGDEHKKQLEDLRQRFASQQQALVKEAGIMDFFHNILTNRGRALGFYEKRYGKQVEGLKKATEKMLGDSQKLLSNILLLLTEMASARASRNPDRYVKAAGVLALKYNEYDDKFKDYYKKQIEGFLSKFMTPTKKVDDKGLGEKEVSAPPSSGPPSSGGLPVGYESTELPPPDALPSAPPTTKDINPPHSSSTFLGVAPQANAPRETLQFPGNPAPPFSSVTPVSKSSPPEEELGYKSDQVAKELGLTAHQNFLHMLQSMSSERPEVLASFISKYARSIQHKDPQTAIHLLQIVKSIRG